MPAHIRFDFCLKIRLNSPVTQSAQTVYPKAYFAFLSLKFKCKNRPLVLILRQLALLSEICSQSGFCKGKRNLAFW
ncbi:hypothetical protein H740_03312 [Campylobacter showae CC57C]|uniref:Uncharacterized protein n=1 Tax=Campylobacter showae CC57C TaxID=1073353 RepID=M3JCN3_9BACT|nr:hypothetical protein H740_03312 [Campylobacter showae CC57C]